MESIKNAIGLNNGQDSHGRKKSAAEEGQEPVSGLQGAGNAAEPFDQGNREDDDDLKGKSSWEADSFQRDDKTLNEKAASLESVGKPATK